MLEIFSSHFYYRELALQNYTAAPYSWPRTPYMGGWCQGTSTDQASVWGTEYWSLRHSLLLILLLYFSDPHPGGAQHCHPRLQTAIIEGSQFSALRHSHGQTHDLTLWVPQLQRITPNRIEDWNKPCLIRWSKHNCLWSPPDGSEPRNETFVLSLHSSVLHNVTHNRIPPQHHFKRH